VDLVHQTTKVRYLKSNNNGGGGGGEGEEGGEGKHLSVGRLNIPVYPVEIYIFMSKPFFSPLKY
jgi:hypothetical protein